MREISTRLNDQGITHYKGRHIVSFQSCWLAMYLVSIVAHTYTHTLHTCTYFTAVLIYQLPPDPFLHPVLESVHRGDVHVGGGGTQILSLSHEHTHTNAHINTCTHTRMCTWKNFKVGIRTLSLAF